MKKSLRNNIRQAKGRFSTEELAFLSSKTTEKVLNDDDVKKSQVILLYSSLPDEVSTAELINTLYHEGKNILLPSVVGDDIELHEYCGKESMIVGAFGIMEPTGRLFSDYNKINVAVIPGMAFDLQGNRLGRGKGYYDRFLPKIPNAKKIGLCYPFQIVESVPVEAHDIPMDKVIS